MFNKLQIDSPYETYEMMKKHIRSLSAVPGLSCEIGLRRGGGTQIICDSFLENNNKRVHVCMDPYGDILYNDIAGEHRSDYNDDMKNETLGELFKYAHQKNLNILFFNMEDSEFYKRFSDGVPVYDREKIIVNTYCFVHIDGQHDLKSVLQAAEFFIPRTAHQGILAFDNTDHYNHQPVHDMLINNEYLLIDECFNKKIYKRV